MRTMKYLFGLLLVAACDGGSESSNEPKGGAAGEAGSGGESGEGGSGGVGAGGGSGGPQPTGMELASPEANEQIQSFVCSSTFDACGGDPVGLWELQAMHCNSDVLSLAFQGLPSCSEVLTGYQISTAGTIRFSAESEVTLDMSFTGMHQLTLDDACLERETSAGQGGCLAFEAQRTVGNQDIACTYAEGACTCEVMLTNLYSATGPYSVIGTAIDDGSSESPFCVDEDTLHFRLTAPDGSFIETTLRRVVADACADHGDCENGLSCCTSAFGHECVEPPLPFPLPGMGPVLCPPGATAAGIPMGEPCADGFHCTSGACHDGVCSEPLADGSRCTTSAACGSGTCFRGFCSSAGQLGAACTSNDACDSGQCCLDDTPSLCADSVGCPGEDGDLCDGDIECIRRVDYPDCVDETYCSHECGGNLSYECHETRDGIGMQCVQSRCRPECETADDCAIFGADYQCVTTDDAYGTEVSVCML